ncbi:hypothetical protein QA802_41185 [Streptomyces sp. B21-105]|uniref:hypothetical protein n=1 Tax=Streptomyces sp. B21-105 TaxID=3039417 RepID=UPI002FF159FF
MTESTSAVEQAVQQRIQQARIKVQAARERRDELSAARRRGLAARHANKLRHLAEREQLRLDAEDDGQDDDEPDCFR